VLNTKKNLKFEFNRTAEGQTIKVYRGNILLNTLIDYFTDLTANLFKRTVKNISYIIQNGKVVLKTKNFHPNFIKKVETDKVFQKNFCTGDIETLTKIDEKGDRYFEPYALAYYNGKQCFNYYVTDFLSWNEMMIKFLEALFKDETNFKEIYFHNLSGFDIHFILKPLVNMLNFKIKILLKDDKYISIAVSNKERTITFKDSLLLLPSSLSNLSKSFQIETPKEIFPRKLFENENFVADYISKVVPDYKYFNDKEVSLAEYENYKNSFIEKSWCLKTETLKYVNIDCIALHQILTKFGDIIFTRWFVDIKNTPTLPALCLRIYRSNYMPENCIPIIKGIPFRDISQSYTGGSTDAFIPYGENIWCYDVNSLYPAAMTKFLYPVGHFISFQNDGNLTLLELKGILKGKDIGFVEAEVYAPLDLSQPILQIRREVQPNQTRTFSPTGSFKGWFHTAEIEEAVRIGYKVKIISGYLFESSDIFSNYINDLYKIKVEADKNKNMIWRMISKNLMNSLYGRFGMDQYLLNTEIINNDAKILAEYISKTQIEDVIELDGKLLIQYLPNNFNTSFYQENLDINISIAIASSVTAYSRILMMKHKNNPSYNLYYTDTDSLYINFNSNLDKEKFDKKFVDPLKLGYLKIENPKINNEYIPFDRMYFLSPKMFRSKTSYYEYI